MKKFHYKKPIVLLCGLFFIFPNFSFAQKSKQPQTEEQKLLIDATFFDANKAKIVGDLQDAVKKYNYILTIDPNNSAAMYEIAYILNRLGKNVDALPYIKKASKIDKTNVWYSILLADCYKGINQIREATKILEMLVKKNPERVDFYFELTSYYINFRKYQKAIRTLDRIEKKIGITEDVSIQKEKLYTETRKFDAAIKEIQKLIAYNPKEVRYYGRLANLYKMKGWDNKAFEMLNELLKVDPDNPYVHLSLADYYREKKQNDKAFDEIKKAFRNYSLDIDTKIRILLSYFTVTESPPEIKAESDSLCKILIESHPDDAKSHSIYADFLYRDKKKEQAREEYRKAIALDKNRYPIWYQILNLDAELNDFEAMYKDSKDAMELYPNEPGPYLFLGMSAHQKKNYSEAVDVLLRGKDYVIDNKLLLGGFYSSLGDAYYQLKEYVKSDENYEKSLEQDPNNVGVLNNYAYYLSLRGENLDKAEKMSRKSNELDTNAASYQDTYAWILYKQNKLDDAKLWLEKAMKNGADKNPVILEHYGDVLYRLGDTKTAFDYWDKAKNAGKGSDFLDKKIADKKLYE